ncbi:MAG TPA: hypothetical protein VGF40_00635 [Thermoanaerobaculia bacterium]
MNNRTISSTFTVLLLTLAIAAPAAGQSPDAAAFRADLVQYVRGLRQLPPPLLQAMNGGEQPVPLDQAEASIAALTDEELRAMEAQLTKVPYWRELPQMLASAASAAAPAGPVPAPMAQEEMDRITREALLAMVATFKNVPRDWMSSRYWERVAAVEAAIHGADSDQLRTLGAGFRDRAPGWQAVIANGGKAPGEGTVGALSHCSSSFPDVVWCNINHVVAELGSVLSQIPQFASSAVDAVKAGVLKIFSDLASSIPTAASLASTLFSNIDWNQVASTIGDNLRLPCPSDGTVIPGFGPTGEVATAVNFAGSVGFLGNAIAAVTPGDILTSVNAQMITQILNFPVQWLSHCLQTAYDEKYETAQEAHRDLVGANLDVKASTRASQASVDGAQGQTNELLGDSVTLDGMVDALNATSSAIEGKTQESIATTGRLEITSSRLEAKSGDIDVDTRRVRGKAKGLDASATDIRADSEELLGKAQALEAFERHIESDVDKLRIQQNQAGDFLGDMKAHYLRMLIESDLVRQANSRISLFQLPGSAGGLIETVQAIVKNALAQKAAAGINTKKAAGDYASAVAEMQRGNYKGAYTFFRSAYQSAVQ